MPLFVCLGKGHKAEATGDTAQTTQGAQVNLVPGAMYLLVHLRVYASVPVHAQVLMYCSVGV